MKKTAALLIFMLFAFTAAICTNPANGYGLGGSKMPQATLDTKVRISFGSDEVIVVLFDNPASKDFVSMLPMTAAFEDYAGVEKISYLPRKLATQGGLAAGDVQGDFTYYAPWGNLAVFYKGFGKLGGLYILGRIESGKDRLASMNGSFSARIELAE